MRLSTLRLSTLRLSLRQQIALLGGGVLVLLAATIVAFIATLRQTESAFVQAESQRLAGAVHALAQQCRELAPALAGAQASPGDAGLALLTGAVLGREPGVEGGYYETRTGALLGYAFPTHPGPRPKHDVPPLERPAILNIARRAAASGRVVSLVRPGRADVILFQAAPVRCGGGVLGSAWAMKRLPGLRLERRTRTNYFGLFLATSALACGVLAFVVARGLQRGVMKIERGLVALEGDLGARIPADNDQREIARIGAAVNRLAGTLRSNLERERQTERRLRHAERLAALGRVAAGVAHEVRNPLATMRLRAQMCRTSRDPETTERSAAVIIEEIDRLDALVERLLTLARPMTAAPQPTDLAGVLEGRLDGYRARATRTGVVVRLARPASPVRVLADPAKLAQVLDNLIQNALDAMEQGGTLETRVADGSGAPDGRARVEIQDSGPGIPSDVIERVFEPFYTTRAHGTGLGLAISYELMRAQDGDIELQSRPGAGTTVTITLPAGEMGG